MCPSRGFPISTVLLHSLRAHIIVVLVQYRTERVVSPSSRSVMAVAVASLRGPWKLIHADVVIVNKFSDSFQVRY